MRTYQVRFDVDNALRLLRCLPPEERIADECYASLRFTDSIELLGRLRRAGLPEEIVHGEGKRTSWTVTFQQLRILGYTEAQLKVLGIFPTNP